MNENSSIKTVYSNPNLITVIDKTFTNCLTTEADLMTIAAGRYNLPRLTIDSSNAIASDASDVTAFGAGNVALGDLLYQLAIKALTPALQIVPQIQLAGHLITIQFVNNVVPGPFTVKRRCYKTYDTAASQLTAYDHDYQFEPKAGANSGLEIFLPFIRSGINGIVSGGDLSSQTESRSGYFIPALYTDAADTVNLAGNPVQTIISFGQLASFSPQISVRPVPLCQGSMDDILRLFGVNV